MKIIKLSDIKEENLPLVVFSCNTKSIISALIRWRTNDTENHVMTSTELGYFDSQNPGGYKRVPYSKYDNKFSQLCIFSLVKDDNSYLLEHVVRRDLRGAGGTLGWYHRAYDYLGILGQLTGLRWIQNPFKKFCSERTGDQLNEVFKCGFKKLRDPGELKQAMIEAKLGEIIGYTFNG